MYPVDTPRQLRTILRTLRQSRGLTQAQLGQLIGVSQKRVARIEAAPEVTAFDQIARMVSAMGGRLVIQAPLPAAKEDSPAGGAPVW
jgi:HTH-type transcriptional regulator/antitoxin HipB